MLNIKDVALHLNPANFVLAGLFKFLINMFRGITVQ